MVAFRGFDEGFPWIYKVGEVLVRFSIPFIIMSLSDQHPYALFVAGGLRSPSLAKAQVEVGDNADAYLVSTDVVACFFRPNLTTLTRHWRSGQLQKWSLLRIRFRKSGPTRPSSPRRWMGLNPG